MSIAAAALDHAVHPAPEATEAPQAAPAQPEVAADPRFDVIAKMERRNKQREQELQAKLKEIEEKEKRFGKYAGVEELVGKNPLQALKELGFNGDLETLNKWALENLGEDELDPVAKRFKEFEEKFAQKDKEYEEKLKAAIEAKEKEIEQRQNEYQIKEFKLNIKKFLTENGGEFELLALQPGADDLVYELIAEDVMRQQKAGAEQIQPMEFKTAAEKLEKYLDAQLDPLLKSKKIQSRFSKPEQNWMENYANRSSATLSNDMVAESKIASEELTPEQRIARAIEKLKNKQYPGE